MRVRRLWTVGLACALTSAACFTSDFPLSPEAESPPDMAVLGKWRCLQSDPESSDVMTLEVTADKTGHYLAAFTAPQEAPSLFRLHPSRIGDATLLNVQEIKDGVAKGDWVFIRYWLWRDHVLDINVLSERALKGQ